MEYDHMELGDLVPEEDGYYRDVRTGNRVDSNGNVYDAMGELIYSSDDIDDEYPNEEFPHK